MKLLIRTAALAASLVFVCQVNAQRWNYSYQKGDFGESSYHFASANKYDAQLTSASYVDYTLSMNVGRADKAGQTPYVYLGGDMLESLAWTVDAVKWTFEIKGDYVNHRMVPSGKDNALFFSRADSRILIPLMEQGTRVRIEALTSTGNLFKETFSLSGSTAAIARVKE